MTDRVTINTYDTHAPDMRKKFEAFGTRISDIEKGFELLGDVQNPIVIEIGCGYGRDGKAIAKRASKYIGFDVSKSMIAIGKAEYPYLDLQVGDALTFVYPKGLQLVFAFASLLHLSQDAFKQVLNGIHHAMVPNGIVYLSLKYDEYHKHVKNDEFGERTFYYYNRHLLENMVLGLFETVHYEEYELAGQDWFNIAMKRK